jgi:hypothetical protein
MATLPSKQAYQTGIAREEKPVQTLPACQQASTFSLIARSTTSFYFLHHDQRVVARI